MFSWTWDFFKRHKRKFIYGGFFAGGGYLLYKYAQRKVKEIQEKEATECLAHARRQHHFDSNQRTCNMTVLSMLPNLRQTLMKLFDTEAITETLKTSPPNKLELWEDLKIMSFARTVCAIYGCSIMCLLLRVQLNVIGGYMYLDNVANRNSDGIEAGSIPTDVQERYLSDIQYFMEHGLAEMTKVVQVAVQKELASTPLKERFSLSNVEACLQQIRERLESSPDISDLESPTVILCQYMLPKETPSTQVNLYNGEKLYQRLMRETRDLVESIDFHTVLSASIDRGFAKLLDSLAEHYKKHYSTEPDQSFHETAIPLAKLVPVVNGLLYKLCSDAPNPLVQEILLLDSTKTFAANIYEAFSQYEDPTKGIP